MLRDGRLTKGFDEFFQKVNSSLSYDIKLWQEDIQGSKAYAKALEKASILSDEEYKIIINGLDQVGNEMQESKLELDDALEDIHMNIEHRLIELTGDVGAKLHTGRSRNEQVILDVRMYLKKEIKNISNIISEFIKTIVEKANENQNTLMPAYTHLQPAQVIVLAHHLLAYASMLKRDYERFQDCYTRTDIMSLGAGACAGTGFDLDRDFMAKELGFENISINSLDAVSDRDFIIEFISASSILMTHLNRLCEDIIFWASAECGYIQLDDSVSSTSSMMPQKKNPDSAEIVRGKVGRVNGNLMTILTIMKGLPLSYNKDMQEDKEPLFDTINTVKNCLTIINKVIETCIFDKDKMLESVLRKTAFLNATDLADYIVKKGVSFRESHKIVGKIVNCALEKSCSLEELPIDDYKEYSSAIEEDVYEYINLKDAPNKRDIYGGTGSSSVKMQIEYFYNWIANHN